MTATDHTLKHEHVTILSKFCIIRQVCIQNLVTLLNGQEIWSAIESLGYVVAKEGVIVGDSLLANPVAHGS